MERQCYVCKETKAIREFSSDRWEGSGRKYKCKSCASSYMREWRRKMPLQNRRQMEWTQNLKSKYGLSPDDYDLILAAQGGRCSICRKPPREQRLHVDHDHETGEIRGLLCSCCNTAIGQLQDDPDIAQAAADYLYAIKTRRCVRAA